MRYKNILTEIKKNIGIIKLNRPKSLNALNVAMMREVNAALADFDQNKKIGAIILTGDDKAFAAGADIKEMANKKFEDLYDQDFVALWDSIPTYNKPVIALVRGYALGGGCEIAMLCDFIIAADNAKFGQPELSIGTIPGGGATQRLTHAIGKAKTMDMCLTGRMLTANEAEQAGLVARVVPVKNALAETIKIVQKIAQSPAQPVAMIRECVNAAANMPLEEGVRFERRLFQASFGTKAQIKGMRAFLQKRAPK